MIVAAAGTTALLYSLLVGLGLGFFLGGARFALSFLERR